ncbi:bifunctional RecB family nuclease/DEAD/DEAH box helicase [Nocardia vaccinii]|uniref:bifunctional RecB family nuclease/DEAD/DEAH box helicase n=1 Tax=Nocardia vaccinii TaxID=1822 RepID=UPI00082DC48F|nr:AAA domain-containing protein [Nocardia vaccinii]
MILFGDRVVCSTGDLVEAARCEFALLRALDAELGLVPTVADTGSAPYSLPMTSADAIDAELDTLPVPMAEAAVRIDPPAEDDPAALVAALERADRRTVAALRAGAPVIADARFFDGEFTIGCALLVRAEPEEPRPAPTTPAFDDDSVVDGDALGATGPAGQFFSGAGPNTVPAAKDPPYHATTDRPLEYSTADHLPGYSTPGIAADRTPEHSKSGARADGPRERPAHSATADRPPEHSTHGPTDRAPQDAVHDATTDSVPQHTTHDATTDSAPQQATREVATNPAPQYSIHGVAGPGSVIGALIELAGCAYALQQYGFRVHPWLRVRLADGSEMIHDLSAAAVVYRARRARLATILAGKQNELLPVQWGDRRYLACGHCPTCTAELVAGRDLLLVAGMRPGVRAQLRDAGITTVDRLAAADSAVTGVAAHTFSALSRQAEVQLRHERTGAAVYTVTDAEALGALPLPSPGDVFLTVTETPATAVGVGVAPAHHGEGGEDPVVLFHAFAIAGIDSADEGFDAADETPDLLEYLLDRQEHHPGMRIYHYRSPVRQLLARLCVRYGADEQIVDDLLGSLVDLYPILRSALIIGQRSYRLADLAELFDGRSETLCENLESECARTLRLREWLQRLAAEHGVRPLPETPRPETEPLPAVEAALREFAFDFDESRSAAQRAAALTAATLAYHRRERQPLHWAHEDRLRRPIAEWDDAPGVLIADWGTVDTKWHSTGELPMRRYLTLTGRLGTGGAPRPGTPVLTVYDRPVPGMAATPGRRATAHATILGCSLDANFDDAVRVEELLPQGCEPYDELPVAIVPGPPGQDENIADALESAAHELLVSLPEVPATAAFDLLLRRPPRLRSGAALPEVFGDHAAAVTAAVLDLDDSYVAVQGPSGTGKTDTAARVVERLVTRYKWRVGVVARSHWSVEQVLDALVRVGVLPELVAKSETHAVSPEWLTIEPSRYPRFLDNAVNGCVIGGLPGDFADAAQVPPGALDLLLIADAGHFSLADAIAVAGSAHNLLLLGDPAPLPGHGIHPEPVHDSTLGRLLGELPTLPDEFGYFLDRTWRMHPQLCGPVSRLRYAGRLRSSETVTLARDLDGVPPGVRTKPIEHHGNSTESAEEAREIVREVRNLLGLPWRQGAVTRRLHPHDILVVTPYHAQVARIRNLLSRARIEDVLVGTPERLAGREAAVVLVSMTTSSPADAPHGIRTLLSRHWITTAVSRAMWTAIIIHSALLTEYLPDTPEQLTDLAAFLELADPRGADHRTPERR